MTQETIETGHAPLTNPLTCAHCGEAIAKGAAMAWTRGERPIRRFWHTPCKTAPRGWDAVETAPETGAARRIGGKRRKRN